MENKIDFEGLAAALLARARDFIPSWLPGGKLVGHEYTCGSLLGGRGDSFKANINTGAWADFASTDKGGDLISLYAAINKIKNSEAAKTLAEQINFVSNNLPPNAAPLSNVPRETMLIAPPEAASLPPMTHGQHGKPTGSWSYRDTSGRLLFLIARYDTKDGKQFLPWSWDGRQWICKAWPMPRPLFGLPELAQAPNRPVLIVEGEKTCEAARKLAGDHYCVVTWPNGSKAVGKADWSPLYGRKVLIWPDADEPGIVAGQEIAKILHSHCPEVKIIDSFNRNDGWDAADAVKDGWTWEQFKAWAKSIVRVFEINVSVTVQTESDNGPVHESCYALWERLGLPQQANGQPIVNEDLALRVFDGLDQFNGKIWFDEFHQKQFTTWRSEGGQPREWRDIDDLTLCAVFQRDFGLRKMTDSTIKKAVRIYAHQHIRNEPRDWMKSLIWDKKQRIETFFCEAFGAENTPYVCAASRNFWLTMVARILFPGCQVDNMVILKGEQGTYKSTALRLIGGKWYTEAHESVTSKDFYMILHGNLLIEISELDAFNRAENNTIKKVVTCATDRFRPPYGTRAENFPRQCVFVGTTNEEQPLKDYTGGRRFWPINIHSISPDFIRDNRDQLFAEAVEILNSENPKNHADRTVSAWWKMPHAETLAAQEFNRQSDDWEEIIDAFLSNRMSTEITVPQVAKDCLFIGADRLDKATQMRIARNLSAIGWKRNLVRKDGKLSRVWIKKVCNQLGGYEF